MKRIFDFISALILIALMMVPLVIIALMVLLTSSGSIIHWSDRVGKNNRLFRMPKYRTMHTDTPEVATHLLHHTEQYLTPIGSFLRKTSLDELPQLWSVLKGDMSFVGPRPALFNQDDLIKLRTEKKICNILPGLTGWAQINGRDDLSIPVKVMYDEYYMNHQSIVFDLKILWKTFYKVMKQEGVACE